MPPPQQGMPQPGTGAPPPQAGYYPPAPPVPMSAYGQPNVAVLPGMYYDQASGLQLPDQTELASVGRRIGAYFLAIPLIIVTLGIGYLIWGLIVWGRGQTPALQVTGLPLLANRDQPDRRLGLHGAARGRRRIHRGHLDRSGSCHLFILMCTRPDRRAIHDMIAGTIVLHDPNRVLAPGPRQ